MGGGGEAQSYWRNGLVRKERQLHTHSCHRWKHGCQRSGHRGVVNGWVDVGDLRRTRDAAELQVLEPIMANLGSGGLDVGR